MQRGGSSLLPERAARRQLATTRACSEEAVGYYQSVQRGGSWLLPVAAAQVERGSAGTKQLNKRRRITDPWKLCARVMVRDHRWDGTLDESWLGPMTVLKQYGTSYAVTDDADGTQLSRLIPHVDMKAASQVPSHSPGALQADIFEVDHIRKDRPGAGQKYYLIRWKGYSPAHDSWEPADNLCPTMIDRYMRDKLRMQPRSKARRKLVRQADAAKKGQEGKQRPAYRSSSGSGDYPGGSDPNDPPCFGEHHSAAATAPDPGETPAGWKAQTSMMGCGTPD